MAGVLMTPLVTLDQQVQPVHTAVLVVDMQNDFCAEGGYLHRKYGIDPNESARLAANIMALVETARATGTAVIWIAAIYDDEYLSESHRARVMARAGGQTLCQTGTWGAELYAGVMPRDDELVVEKHRYSAFHGTDLNEALGARGIRTLIITGVATNVCVDSTLRDGFFEGYHVVLPEDCVGAGDDAAQQVTLTTVANNFGYVTSSQALVQLLKSQTAL